MTPTGVSRFIDADEATSSSPIMRCPRGWPHDQGGHTHRVRRRHRPQGCPGDGRPGPAPSVQANRRERDRKPTGDMVVIVEDVMQLLDKSPAACAKGHYPDKGHHPKVAQVLQRRRGRSRGLMVCRGQPDAVLVGAADVAGGADRSAAEPGIDREHRTAASRCWPIASRCRHYFDCLAYCLSGWQWAVVRAPRARRSRPSASPRRCPPTVPRWPRLVCRMPSAPGTSDPAISPPSSPTILSGAGFRGDRREDVDAVAL